MNTVRTFLCGFPILLIPAMISGQTQTTLPSQSDVRESSLQDSARAVVPIVVVGKAGDKHVVPPKALARPGDMLMLNFGSHEGMAFFPDAELLFGSTQKAYETKGTGKIYLKLRDAASIRNGLGLKPGRVIAHEFPYAVYCLDTEEFARGDSAPVIIIEETRR